MIRKLSAAFSAGFAAALLSGIYLWLLGSQGVLGRIGVTLRAPLALEPMLTTAAYGGLWGALFLLPLLKGRVALRGLVLALAPALFTLCYQLPRAGKGLFALGYGDWAPLVVLSAWIVWGIAGAAWHKAA